MSPIVFHHIFRYGLGDIFFLHNFLCDFYEPDLDFYEPDYDFYEQNPNFCEPDHNLYEPDTKMS